MAEHVITYGRKVRGRSPIAGTGNRNLYATTARCSCGTWKVQINEAPSKGGRKAAEKAASRHIEKAVA